MAFRAAVWSNLWDCLFRRPGGAYASNVSAWHVAHDEHPESGRCDMAGEPIVDDPVGAEVRRLLADHLSALAEPADGHILLPAKIRIVVAETSS